jgi:hypothetical protein
VKLVHLVRFIIKKIFVTMHGHMKLKNIVSCDRTGIVYCLMTEVFALVMQFQIQMFPGSPLMTLEFL